MGSIVGKLEDVGICSIFISEQTKEMGIESASGNGGTIYFTKEEAEHLVEELVAMINKFM